MVKKNIGAKGHWADCNYSGFASLFFSDALRKSHLWVLLRSHTDSSPTEWTLPSLLSPLPTSISCVSGHYKLLCLQDYLSIRGRMKCEKQSEKHWDHRYTTSGDAIMPMTDHFLTFIPQPSWMAVCHCDSTLFVFLLFTILWQSGKQH